MIEVPLHCSELEQSASSTVTRAVCILRGCTYEAQVNLHQRSETFIKWVMAMFTGSVSEGSEVLLQYRGTSLTRNRNPLRTAAGH